MASAAAKRAGVGAIATTCSIDHATSTDTTDGVSRSARTPAECGQAHAVLRTGRERAPASTLGDGSALGCGAEGSGVQFRHGRRSPPCGNGDRPVGRRPDREHAARAAASDQRARADPQRAGDEDGDDQPRRLVEGPPGAGDDPRRRARRAAAARRHDRRADQRQHRRRPRHRRRPARLPVRVRDDRQGRAGEDLAAQGLRRRGRRVPGRRRPGGPAELLLGRRAAHRRARGVPPQPVRQPGQPAGPRADHRARAVGADGRAHHPLRRRRRHVRDDHRRRPLPQGAEPGDQDHRRRPRGLGVLGRIGPAVPRRGRRRGLLPRGVGPRPLRRRHRHQRRGELPHRPPGVRGRGHPHRRLGRHGGGRGDPGRQAGRPRRHRRRAQPRLRPRLPVAGLRRRVDGQLRLPARVRRVRRRRARRPPRARPSCSTSTPTRRCARRSS